MRWYHDTLRACTLDVGSGRGSVKIDREGYVVEMNEYARHALELWATSIGFTKVDDAPTESAPAKKRKRATKRQSSAD
jgi:hypothetical protein